MKITKSKLEKTIKNETKIVENLVKEEIRRKNNIDLAKRWVGLIGDPKQLEDQALNRFIEEAIALKLARGWKLRIISDSFGKVLCACRWYLPPFYRSKEPVSEETLRKTMVKLFLPLVKEEFTLTKQHESELKKQKEPYQKLIKDYEAMCKTLMQDNNKLKEEKQKCEDENFKLKERLNFKKQF